MAKKKEQLPGSGLEAAPEKKKKPTTVTKAIIAVTGVGELIAETIASECSKELQTKIVEAFDAGKPSQEIFGLIGQRKTTAATDTEAAAQPTE